MSQVRSRRPQCGASILSELSVLTAAHCVQSARAEELVVVVGDQAWDTQDTGETRRRVCGVVRHPGYRHGRV